MNIETANRLYEYRKKMGFSQEELAARIGVSRQAVSKWERAEASPDTDNLIELSKVYGVTLDEMLRGTGSAADASAAEEPAEEPAAEASDADASAEPEEKVHIGWHGIHVQDKHGAKVDIDHHGIFVEENGEQKVWTDENGVVHRPKDYRHHDDDEHKSFWHYIPYPLIATIAFLLFGFFNVCGGWAWGWIVFLTIPIYYTLIGSIEKRNANIFCYPILALIIFLILGVFGYWNVSWIIFLTIPIYYGVVNGIRNAKKPK